MGDNATFWLPEGNSTISGEIDAVFYLVYWISLVIFVLVVAAMAYFAIRYRRKSESDIPAPVHESKLLEAAWIVIPTILCLVVFTYGFRGYVKLNAAPPNSYEVQALAKQWLWEFSYSNGAESIGELHVPVDRPVRVVMSSEDVLHSFFVPVFRVKQDVLPNRYTSVWFEATKTGEFEILCTEYCGLQHSGMLGKVVVHSQEDFDTWLQEANADLPPVELGERLYTQNNCNTCHSLDGSVVIGPSFQGLFGSQRQFTEGPPAVADENYLRESILNPAAKIVQGFGPVMPASYSSMSAKNLDALIAYIKTIE